MKYRDIYLHGLKQELESLGKELIDVGRESIRNIYNNSISMQEAHEKCDEVYKKYLEILTEYYDVAIIKDLNDTTRSV